MVANVQDYIDDKSLEFSDNSRAVMERRYLLKNESGEVVETPAQMFYRVANHVAEVDEQYGYSPEHTTRMFYNLMATKKFFPNSPTFTGAGTPLGQLSACFVLPLDDDMGKEEDGIFNILRKAVLIQQTGGGNGFSFSRLRPKGDIVKSSNGKASGPVSFLRAFNAAFGEVHQGGVRRGANMAVLRVDHPDIEEFIECKSKEGDIANFNISVAITDEFMEKVRQDASFDLINPRDGSIWETVDAKALFSKISKHAYQNGEPGVLFIDTANRSNPVPHLYELEATNPCAEQWLGPYENCCLGSINLAEHVISGETDRDKIDWVSLEGTVRIATHFLDNVISANTYVPSVPQLRESALSTRRIGLGIMGLGDLFYMLDVRYGSEESLELASQIMEFVRYYSMLASCKLAQERGRFPAFEGSIYDNGWTAPPSQSSKWGRPDLDWPLIEKMIKDDGIRNAAQTTIAPTGTIATVCGVEGYGCEPVFALGYIRHFDDGGTDRELSYVSPILKKVLEELVCEDVISGEEQMEILEHIKNHGSLGHYLSEPYLNSFVTSGDITPEEHINMQAALQTYVDNSLSKTINMPHTATPEDVENAYILAWKSGCKGITVYVEGSRDKVVLETHKTKESKQQQIKHPRPSKLTGSTYRKDTPLGRAYVTINHNGSENPLEVFLTVGKAGSDVNGLSEAMGRLMSLILRSPMTVASPDRIRWIAEELKDIGGSNQVGFGPNRVKSLPDGVAQILLEHLGEKNTNNLGELCPDCGQFSLIEQEGCQKCLDCGYSKC